MKTNSLGVTIVALALSSIYYGCVAVEDRAVFSPTAVITGVGRSGTGANRAKLTKLAAEIETGVCHANFSVDPETGKIIKDSLKASPSAQCAVQHTDPPLTINGKKVLEIGAVEFITEGSCRYCWVNS